MWCQKCQAEVAAQASLDNQRVQCTSCGTDLLVSSAAGSKPLRDPRELLARWAQEDAADPFGPLLNTPREVAGSRTGSSAQSDTIPIRPGALDRLQPVRRLDSAHSAEIEAPNLVEQGSGTRHGMSGGSIPPRQILPGYYAHGAHLPPEPHFQMLPTEAQVKSARWMTIAGQLSAYLGVATLTVGAVLVLLSYFGGPAQYAPTGWLVTTAGQMLLFLGVVTLISGGMEQTSHEVSRRIESLGQKLHRIEQLAGSRDDDRA